MSVTLEVVLKAPWVLTCSTPATVIPMPTWTLLMPPRSSVGATAERIVDESMLWKLIRPDLKALVLTLAMLFPITSIYIWCILRPVIAAFIERSITCVLLSCARDLSPLQSIRGGSSPDGTSSVLVRSDYDASYVCDYVVRHAVRADGRDDRAVLHADYKG